MPDKQNYRLATREAIHEDTVRAMLNTLLSRLVVIRGAAVPVNVERATRKMEGKLSSPGHPFPGLE